MEINNERFTLRCRVIAKDMSFRDKQSAGKEWNEKARVVLLKPDVNTECSRFFDERLPILDEEYTEVGMLIGGPVFGFVRGALRRGTKICDRPHIFVMSKRAENVLKYLDGREIEVVILSEDEEGNYDEPEGKGISVDEFRAAPEKSERGLYE